VKTLTSLITPSSEEKVEQHAVDEETLVLLLILEQCLTCTLLALGEQYDLVACYFTMELYMPNSGEI